MFRPPVGSRTVARGRSRNNSIGASCFASTAPQDMTGPTGSTGSACPPVSLSLLSPCVAGAGSPLDRWRMRRMCMLAASKHLELHRRPCARKLERHQRFCFSVVRRHRVFGYESHVGALSGFASLATWLALFSRSSPKTYCLSREVARPRNSACMVRTPVVALRSMTISNAWTIGHIETRRTGSPFVGLSFGSLWWTGSRRRIAGSLARPLVQRGSDLAWGAGGL